MEASQIPQEACQALTPVREKTLEKWALQMGAQYFTRTLDISKALAVQPTQGEGGVLPFLDRCAALPACFASAVDLRRVCANARDCFRKPRDQVRKHVDGEGFTLGLANCAVLTGRRPLTVAPANPLL